MYVCICMYARMYDIVMLYYDCVHREHAMLVKIAGVRHLVVLINKMDDPTVTWSEERWVCMCVRVCVCVYVCVCVCLCLSIYVSVSCVHICGGLYVYTCVCVCTHVSLSVQCMLAFMRWCRAQNIDWKLVSQPLK